MPPHRMIFSSPRGGFNTDANAVVKDTFAGSAGTLVEGRSPDVGPGVYIEAANDGIQRWELTGSGAMQMPQIGALNAQRLTLETNLAPATSPIEISAIVEHVSAVSGNIIQLGWRNTSGNPASLCAMRTNVTEFLLNIDGADRTMFAHAFVADTEYEFYAIDDGATITAGMRGIDSNSFSSSTENNNTNIWIYGQSDSAYAVRMRNLIYRDLSQSALDANDLLVAGHPDTNYPPAPELSAATPYIWRIDSINAAGKTPGDDWIFDTS